VKRPAAILYALAGSPPQDGCALLDAPTRCVMCAVETTIGARFARWVGSMFTDYDKLRAPSSDYVCPACVWSCEWNPPPGVTNPPGKKGVNLRLFSHLYDARGYVYANKANKPEIRAWLCAPKSPPWFAAVADSGQKHTVPWATTNIDEHRGIVRFEERDVWVDSRGLTPFIGAANELLTAGATKAEIETGVYRPETWVRCESVIRAYEERYSRERGGGLAALVLWLAQRDEEKVAARMAAETEAKRGRGKARQSDRSRGRSAAGSAERVPRKRGKRTEALATDPRPSAPCDEDEREDGRVGDDVAAPTESREPEQLGLFGDGGALH
jgi:CRISPR type IV-associated protein Csf1